MGPRAGLDRYRKTRPHGDSIPGPSSPQPVAIPNTLPGPKNFSDTIGNRTHDLPGCSAVTQPIALHWQRYSEVEIEVSNLF